MTANEPIEKLLPSVALDKLRSGASLRSVWEEVPSVALGSLTGHGDVVKRHDLVEIQTWSGNALICREVVWVFDIWAGISDGTYVFSYSPADGQFMPAAPLKLALTNGDVHSSTGTEWKRTFKVVEADRTRIEQLEWRKALLLDPYQAAECLRESYVEGSLSSDVIAERYADVVNALMNRHDALVRQSQRWNIRLFDSGYTRSSLITIEGSYGDAIRNLFELSQLTSCGTELLTDADEWVSFSPSATQELSRVVVEEDGDNVFLALLTGNSPSSQRECRLVEVVCDVRRRSQVARLLATSLPHSFAMFVRASLDALPGE